MSAVTLRAAARADEPFLRALFRTTREPLIRALGWSGARASAFCDMQFDAQASGYRSSYPDAEYLVVLDADARPIGRMTRALTAEGMVLVDIALIPPARGRGIGTSLLRGLQEEAGGTGRALLLSVETTNPARALYRRMGFEVVQEDGMQVRMLWKNHKNVEGGNGKWTRISEK
jgi:ribosomal protein S18 acetylase RimI-like enzyme